jgi:hypothetical protein
MGVSDTKLSFCKLLVCIVIVECRDATFGLMNKLTDRRIRI